MLTVVSLLLHAAELSEDGQTFDMEEGSGLVVLKDVLNEKFNKNGENSRSVESKKKVELLRKASF